jgi:predicted peptidase
METNLKRSIFLFLPVVGALAACGGGDPATVEEGPRLASMEIQTSAHNGETIAFQRGVFDYTVRVQSDVYGVLLKAAPATPDAQVAVTAAITAGAYSTTNPNTDVNQAENVPASTVYGQSGHLVKLSQSYAAFDVEHTQTATVSVTHPGTGMKTDYRLNIVRDNDSAIRAKFGSEKVFTSVGGTSIKYRVYFPPNYQTSTKTYPVVLALHGVGQRAAGGQPSDMVLKRTKQATIWAQDSEQDPSKEAIVIAPQANTCWVTSDDVGTLCSDGQAAYELLQDVLAKEKVNPSRVYLTGLSLGGNGSLVMAETYPQTFAALWIHAAWAGSPNSDTVTGNGFNWAGLKQYLNGRIRLDQAADDPQVQVKNYNNLVAKLNTNGISYETKLYSSGTFFYPDAHFSWIASYADKSARDWMFSLSK